MTNNTDNTPDWEGFARDLLDEWPVRDVEGSELFEAALRNGLIAEIPGGYDPEQHIDAEGICPEAGDPWYEYAFHPARADLALDPLADPRVKALVEAAGELSSIVEGIQGAFNHGTWRDEKNGMRLKDTNEWVALYVALAAFEGVRPMTDDPRCAKCSHPRSNHPYRHPFVAPSRHDTIKTLADRIKELEPKMARMEAVLKEIAKYEVQPTVALSDFAEHQHYRFAARHLQNKARNILAELQDEARDPG